MTIKKKKNLKKKKSITDIYLNYKKKYQEKYGKKCVVLLESGHFMEMYDYREDSDHFDVCRNVLNIMVTHRDKDPKSSQYSQFMAGIPSHSIKRYYKTLLKNNYTVIIVEQVTAPPNPEREVTKILSPGCYLSEDLYNNSDSGSSIILSIYCEIDDENDYYIDLGVFDTNIGESRLESIICMDKSEEMNNLEENQLNELVQRMKLIEYNEIIITIVNDNKNLNEDDCKNKFMKILRNKKILNHFNYFKKRNDEGLRDFFNIDYQKKFLETLFSNFKHMYTTIHESLNLVKQNPSMIANYVILLNFVYEHDKNLVLNLPRPKIKDVYDDHYLRSYNDTYKKLNVFDQFGDKKRSLFNYLDFTNTKSGKRLLIERLKRPLLDVNELNKRYDYIDEILGSKEIINEIDEYLNIHDLDRIYRRFSIGRLNPYEIPRIIYSNDQIINLSKLIIENSDNLSRIREDILVNEDKLKLFEKYSNEINRIFNYEKCKKVNLQNINDTLFNEGIFCSIDDLVEEIKNNLSILDNFARELSKLIYDSDDKNSKKKKLEVDENEENKYKNYVVIRCNDKEGYWLDVTKLRGNKLKKVIHDNKIRKVIVDVESKKEKRKKFNFDIDKLEWNNKNKTNIKLFSQEIKMISKKIVEVREKLIRETKKKYIEEIQRLYNEYYNECIETIGEFIKNIDVINSSAKCANLYKYERPEIMEVDESFIEVEDLRHPIIEQIIKSEGSKYVYNSININSKESYLVYGVNSVGKSSFLKSLVIGIIMAQSGLYVSCSKMRLGIYKKLFTRIGNNDNLFMNHSSFVNEIIESKEIIEKCDKNSFVIADELCSSTEMESAIKIVSSIIKILSEKRSSFIFATHIFKLYDLNMIRLLKNVRFKHLKVRFEESLIFDRTLMDGLPENRSYGAIVAKKIIMNNRFNELMENNINFKMLNEEEDILDTMIKKKFSKYNKKLILDKCEICGYRPKNNDNVPLETHHIEMQCEADEEGFHGLYHKNELHNLIVLCKKCHEKVHKDEIIDLKYEYTDNGRKIFFEERKKDLKYDRSKKKKKKYDEKDISMIKNYYEKNMFKIKSQILSELRMKNNLKKLSNETFSKIITDKY